MENTKANPELPIALSGNTGVELPGFDLGSPLGPEHRAAIVDLFNEHAVVLFRDQDLAPAAQIEFTELFGACEPHPLPSHRGPAAHPELLIVEHRKGFRSRRNDRWHTDISFAQRPPSATVLHAIEVPQNRGDTLFCNMVSAARTLSPSLLSTLSSLRAVHTAGPEVAQVHKQAMGHEDLAAPPPVLHPVIRTHAPSAQKSIFVNPFYTTHFEGMTVEESRPMLELLFTVALQPEHIYRHRWQAGDVLLWDNSRTMHYAIRDYGDDVTRVMHRTTAAGPQPS
jgi:alpha-ketoglutarate-dependent taurine dioxygenase